MRIEPTVGRIVWYHPGPRDQQPLPADGTLAAIIAHVPPKPENADGWDRVNLTVFDMAGNPYARCDIPLVQDGQPPLIGAWCEWMPYQKGQAAKTEQLQRQAAAAEDSQAAQTAAPKVVSALFRGRGERAAYEQAFVEGVAEVCHEVNRAYCLSQDDHSQPAWSEAPAWQRDSAIAGVRHALDNPDAEPVASHESWLKQKLADGWTYGPVKDPETKQHPCMVPYDQLPASEKAKDYIFLAVVRQLASA